LDAQIADYEVKDVMLDLGSYVNILPKKSWEMMGQVSVLTDPVAIGQPIQDFPYWKAGERRSLFSLSKDSCGFLGNRDNG
jgi:hypothetical protein